MHRPSAETETFTDTCRQKYRAKMTHTHKKGKYTQTQTTHTHADAHGRELQVQNAPTLCQPPQVPEKEWYNTEVKMQSSAFKKHAQMKPETQTTSGYTYSKEKPSHPHFFHPLNCKHEEGKEIGFLHPVSHEGYIRAKEKEKNSLGTYTHKGKYIYINTFAHNLWVISYCCTSIMMFATILIWMFRQLSALEFHSKITPQLELFVLFVSWAKSNNQKQTYLRRVGGRRGASCYANQAHHFIFVVAFGKGGVVGQRWVFSLFFNFCRCTVVTKSNTHLLPCHKIIYTL